MSDSPWPPYVARTFHCSCGVELGVSENPARSTEDGRELGISYLALEPNSLSGAVLLWKVGTGDAGYWDQRCPGCGAGLVAAPDQESLF